MKVLGIILIIIALRILWGERTPASPKMLSAACGIALIGLLLVASTFIN